MTKLSRRQFRNKSNDAVSLFVPKDVCFVVFFGEISWNRTPLSNKPKTKGMCNNDDDDDDDGDDDDIHMP